MAAFEQFLNDKYLSALHSPLISSYLPGSTSMDKFELATMSDNTLLDFLASTPPPVTKLLVEYSSIIYGIKQLAFAASWKGPSEQSFLLLFAWWAVCLYGSILLRYALVPLLLLSPVIWPYLPKRWKSQKQTPTTEGALASSLSYLDATYALKPDVILHDPLPSEVTVAQRLRILGFLLPPYIALTYWVPMRVLVAVAGSVILTYRAPWTVTTRRILSRSAYVRAAWRYIVGWLSGTTPLPILSRSKTLIAEPIPMKPETKVQHHKFLFTVLENQRWWMGLDWTAALLPNERPSWCAPLGSTIESQSSSTPTTQTSYVPLPPPASFPLPPVTTVVLPSPTGKGFVKKTARWEWEENGEWEVLVHKEGEQEIRKLRVPVRAATMLEEPKGAVLAKAAGKLGVQSPTASTIIEKEGSGSGDGSAVVPSQPQVDFTDQDGWVYGDNKWENKAAKGGMGKFTRFRRWCRVAVLVETEEAVDNADEGLSFVRVEEPVAATDKLQSPTTKSRSRGNSTKSDATGSPERTRGRTMDSKASEQDGSLQKRLKAALKSGG